MDEKYEVAFVIPELNNFGGIQTLALDTAKLLNANSSKYSASEYGWYYSDIKLLLRGVLRYSPSFIAVHLYNIIVRPYYKKRKNFKADLYHYWIIDASLPYDTTPFVLTVHGKEILQSNITGFRRSMYRLAMGKAAVIHANSNYTKGLIKKSFPTIDVEKVVVINPSVPYAHSNSRIKDHSHNEYYVIGTLTRLVARKNVLNIIKSLVILRDKYKLNFIYHLAGDGPERKKIISQLNRSKINYKYLGIISEKEKFTNYYAKLNIFVLPPTESRKDVEGFGIVFLEANQFGVPVVASNTGGVSDAVKPGVSGLFADPLNPDDIAKKINDILTGTTNYARSSQEWAQNFNSKITNIKFEQLYDLALSKSRK